MKNLWILTEERPKTSVLKEIFKYFAKDHKIGFFGDNIRIIPILNKSGKFSFTYQILGFTCSQVGKVYLKTVSGSSSFTDYLIFYQNSEPTAADTPIYAIEETKTDDKESRNTGVFQRCSKFVFIKNYYPSTKKIMLYSIQVGQKKKPTDTYIFGTRLLLTIGVAVWGKDLDPKIFKPFSNIDEIIKFKQNMTSAHSGNTPIAITKDNNKVFISGRLVKDNRLAHDPNIGALSIISDALRKLGWKGEIIITQHGLSQCHIGIHNKFIQIANSIGIKLDGLKIPVCQLPKDYWHYETQGEKLGTIFIHLVVENFTSGYSIFENHAGCEKGYFITQNREYIPLVKYTDREAYKAGDKTKIVNIPDLVLLDIDEKESITIEGKKYKNKQKGIEELKGYDSFENLYLKKYYSEYKTVRTVVLYGSDNESIGEVEVGFLLNSKGKLVLGINAPKLFLKAITNLLGYWQPIEG